MVERGGGVATCIVVGSQGAVTEDRVGGGEGCHGKHARVMFRVEVYYKRVRREGGITGMGLSAEGVEGATEEAVWKHRCYGPKMVMSMT
jgi:hypothetical protein